MKKRGTFIIFLVSISAFSQIQRTIDSLFLAVEKAPIYEGCEKNETNSSRKKCMDISLTEHVKNHFNFELVNCLKQKTIYNRNKGRQKKCIPVLLPGEKRIYIDFKISKTGNIENVTARAPHEKLKDEAIRVGKLIPKMIPAQQNGESVELNYTIPIDFTIKQSIN